MPEGRAGIVKDRLATGRKNEPIQMEKSGEKQKSGRAGKASGQLGPRIRTGQEGPASAYTEPTHATRHGDEAARREE